MPELNLSSYRGNWQQFALRRGEVEFAKVKEQVLARDADTCSFCRFKSAKYHEVINLDHNYLNNDINNLATACSMCYPCLLLDGAAMDEVGAGLIIFLPEISQLQLNHFCRNLFCGMLDEKAAYNRRLHSVYLSLKERKKQVENTFGPETFQPAVFGQAMIDSNLPSTAFNHGVLQQLRLLPAMKALEHQIQYWMEQKLVALPN